MSSSTWTPTAVSSEAAHRSLTLWRAVEAQHVVSTRRLVDSDAEQIELESLLEVSKPRLPEPCHKLDYLLATPFRYAPRRGGSRFRGAFDDGVFYGAEALRTACAELSFHRIRFLRDSAGLERLLSVPHTLFKARAAGRTIDLRRPPFADDHEVWTDPDVAHYAPCQAFGRTAREAGVEIIRYQSVRDPQAGACAAVMTCRALAGGAGVRERQTWFLSVERRVASWVRVGERPGRGTAFEFRF